MWSNLITVFLATGIVIHLACATPVPQDAVSIGSGSPAEPTNLTITATIPRDVSVGDQPEGFTVEFQFDRRYVVRIFEFFAVAIGALQTVGLFDYFQSSQGYYGDPGVLQLIVIPSESQRPHLQNSHIIWAIYLTADTIWKERLYYMFEGIIRVHDVVVGTISYNRHRVSGDQQLQNLTLLDGVSPGSLGYSPGATTNISAELSNDPPFDMHHIQGGAKLDGLAVFITTVRGLTDLAVPASEAKAVSYTRQDDDTGVQIQMEAVPGLGSINYGAITLAIAKIAVAGILTRNFKETQVTWYLREVGVTPIGELKELKYAPGNSSALQVL